jgi:anti-sigma factor RsiW
VRSCGLPTRQTPRAVTLAVRQCSRTCRAHAAARGRPPVVDAVLLQLRLPTRSRSCGFSWMSALHWPVVLPSVYIGMPAAQVADGGLQGVPFKRRWATRALTTGHRAAVPVALVRAKVHEVVHSFVVGAYSSVPQSNWPVTQVHAFGCCPACPCAGWGRAGTACPESPAWPGTGGCRS